ncbi:Neuropeptide-Like Protein [Caenorhabditis elegans]|uniref:Neuropeptide-Like Protein n=1 Tax=Caenorhabditis elegans TaxID=6239 RepID=Q22739_CAEEL|nr:Neuropeptide-Like Protein [Caenorhabditis elegans]CCD71462.1 Neuropeptide-Like Protein [Caenorhabditis elegans]|eukprot:NP_508426.1 Neuropeptide-Like Protein [Caenorhabditis elegans]
MRATLVLFALLCAVYSEAVPLQVYRPDESSAVDVVVLENSPELYDSEDEDEWKQEEEFTEGAMGKRSIALGRSGFRPGKRSMDNFHTVDVSDLIMKRSMAMGRLGLRPGKRSMAYGRQGFRPGKRSMAYGRQGFRPGKRSMAYGRQGFRPGKRSNDMKEVFPQHVPEIYII